MKPFVEQIINAINHFDHLIRRNISSVLFVKYVIEGGCDGTLHCIVILTAAAKGEKRNEMWRNYDSKPY